MSFKWYGKIHRIGKVETEWLLDWVCTVQEKVDGANLSIWSDEDEGIQVWSRTQNVTLGSFRGAVEYVKAHQGILNYFGLHKSHRMYWEWLVPHTITSYNAENYNNFYLFDIEDEDGKRLPQSYVRGTAELYGIRTPHTFAVITNPTIDNIMEFVGKSTLGPIGEGVVIKNESFVNKYGDKCYGKIVSDEFKEDNTVVFGNAASDDAEMKLVSRYVTIERIRKIMNKIEQNEDVDISRKHIAKIIGMTYYDFLQEEVMAVAKCGIVNFKRLNSLSTQKIARIVLDIIDWHPESVAFNN